jgi:hypothetical protein
MTAQIAKTVRANLEAAANDRHLLAQELSATIRVLDRAERRERANATTVPYLAAAILNLDSAAKDIAAWRPRHSEPVDPFLVSEHAALKDVLDQKIKHHLVTFGEPELVALMAREGKAGVVKWAQRIVKRIAAEKAATETRKTARAAGKPSPAKAKAPAAKPSATASPWDDTTIQFVMAKMKSGRPGYCDTCGKPRERKTLQGLCEECISTHFPKLARR